MTFYLTNNRNTCEKRHKYKSNALRGGAQKHRKKVLVGHGQNGGNCHQKRRTCRKKSPSTEMTSPTWNVGGAFQVGEVISVEGVSLSSSILTTC